jgi:hypothetical protein
MSTRHASGEFQIRRRRERAKIDLTHKRLNMRLDFASALGNAAISVAKSSTGIAVAKPG